MSKLQTSLRQRWQRLRRPARFGSLRRTTPLSSEWGFERGIPVDRYYIQQFLTAQRMAIHGRVVEIKNSDYTNQFGVGVTQRDVLDIDSANVQATIIADLTAADHIEAEQFDCFILTQTLQLIFDMHGAVYHTHRLLKPGGVALITVPCISRIVPRYGLKQDYWRFTVASCTQLFGGVFGHQQVEVQSYGNVLAATAFLNGVAYQELSEQELNHHDPYFPLIISVRAVKALR